MKITAVIPIRSGSQRVKDKNLRAFMGHRTKRFFQWSGKMGERF